MADIKLANIPSMAVDKLVDKLSNAYCNVISKGLSVKTLPSVMLWGAPGVGKSQAVRQIADVISARTGKKTNVTDVRLLLFNPIDLRGIPTANEDKTLAIWLKPQIFQMDESESVVNILFLDEISAAPPSVQAAAYQITLDRVVGEHRLPDNCIVITAGNRMTDKSVVFKMPKALANRLLHIEVESNFSSWKKWAISRGINAKVVAFLSFRQDLLNAFDPAKDDIAFATPRSWEMVSNLLNYVDDSIENNFSLICGLVGSGIAVEFRTWSKVYSTLPKIEDVFNGKKPPVPRSTDALYALVSSMVKFASEHKDDLILIANSLAYADLLPADFGAVLVKDYLVIEDGYKNKLMILPEFTRWLSKKGKLLNGSI